MLTPYTVAAKTTDQTNVSGFLSLKNDLENLPEVIDGISPEENIAKERIFILYESEDPEVKQAFGIMEEYGVPVHTFNYRMPDYNTQLEILFWLAEKRDITTHKRLASAIALDYGAVLSICEDDVKEDLKIYVLAMYDYFIETGEIVSLDTEKYSLESNIALVWGADSISSPYFFEAENQYPEGTTYGDINSIYSPIYPDWAVTFCYRQMNLEDFEWYFVETDTLEEMREFLLSEKFSTENVSGSDFENIADSIDVMLSSSLEYYGDYLSAELNYIPVDGKITPGCGISNPDWQWEYFRNNGHIIGCCRDVACMDTFFLKSINIPCAKVSIHWDSFGHQIVVFNDAENSSIWRIPPHQQYVLDHNINNSEVFLSNYYPVGWLNWHNILLFPPRSYESLRDLEDGFDISPASLQEAEIDDWNPWNDPDSESGTSMTRAELQEAINYWLTDSPISSTGAIVTTDRLQYLIHCWIDG
nr:hypothetical protein [uncultured Methanolobus sp.]